jgi:hypothetical protein
MSHGVVPASLTTSLLSGLSAASRTEQLEASDDVLAFQATSLLPDFAAAGEEQLNEITRSAGLSFFSAVTFSPFVRDTGASRVPCGGDIHIC